MAFHDNGVTGQRFSMGASHAGVDYREVIQQGTIWLTPIHTGRNFPQDGNQVSRRKTVTVSDDLRAFNYGKGTGVTVPFHD